MSKKKKQSIGIGRRFAFNLVAVIFILAMKLYLGFKCNTDETVKRWKKEKDGFIILSEHPAKLDAVVLLAASFPRFTRFVVGAQHLTDSAQGNTLKFVGVIPKKQFTPDIKAIKEMLKTVKGGMVLGMMPEGRVSYDGTQNCIDISTAKLVKSLGCKVAALVPHGSYFVKPPYRYNGVIKGNVSCDLKAVLTKEDVAALNDEEILDRIVTALTYNTADDIKARGWHYGSRRDPVLKDVSKLFYLCPKCGQLYTITDDGKKIGCCNCGFEMLLGDDAFFHEAGAAGNDNKADCDVNKTGECAASSADDGKENGDCSVSAVNDMGLCKDSKPCGEFIAPSSIVEWNKVQLSYEHKFWESPDACLDFPIRKGVMILGKDKDFVDKCDGRLKFTRDGLTYEDEEEQFFTPLEALIGFSADYQQGYLTYYDNSCARKLQFQDNRTVGRFVNSLAVLKGEK